MTDWLMADVGPGEMVTRQRMGAPGFKGSKCGKLQVPRIATAGHSQLELIRRADPKGKNKGVLLRRPAAAGSQRGPGESRVI